MAYPFRTNHGVMTTASGKRMKPLDPKVGDICIEDIAHHLGMEVRFMGAVNRFYSVAEHCVLVVNIAASDSTDKTEPLLSTFLTAALLHDASEAYLKDLPAPLKEMPEMEWYRQADAHLQRYIEIHYGCSMTFELRKQITAADLLARNLEASILMPAEYEPAPLPPGFFNRFGHLVICFDPTQAKQLFLNTFFGLRK